jgi:hypothetical protein
VVGDKRENKGDGEGVTDRKKRDGGREEYLKLKSQL